MAALPSVYKESCFARHLGHYELCFLRAAVQRNMSLRFRPRLLYPPRHQTHITDITSAPVHVEPAPRRREAVTVSGGRWGAGRVEGEVRPGHRSGIEHVQVIVDACVGRECGGFDSRF